MIMVIGTEKKHLTECFSVIDTEKKDLTKFDKTLRDLRIELFRVGT